MFPAARSRSALPWVSSKACRYTSHRWITSLGLALACWVPLGAVAQNRPTPVPVNAEFNAQQSAAALLKVTGAPAFKGIKRVAITQFSAEFTTFDSIESRAGFGLGGAATQITRVHFSGVGQAEFQALIDQLRNRFRQQLTDAGFEVLTDDQVTASAVYGRLSKGGSTVPMVEDTRVVVSAQGLGLYGMNRTHVGVKSKAPAVGPLAALGALNNMATGLSTVSIIPDSMELQKDLGGDVALIEVHLRLHFADLSAFTGRIGTSNTASTVASSSPQITFGNLNVLAGTTLGVLTLDKPLGLDAKAIPELKERPKTTTEKAGAVAGALLAFAAKSSSNTESSTYDAVADPVQYPAVITAGFEQLVAMWNHRIQAMR